MAQGKFKSKGSLPKGVKGRQSHRQKSSGPKRGARVIAPKKTKQIEANKIKKGLERSIKTSIEHEAAMKAQSVEPKQFKLVKPTASTASTSEKGSNVKKK
ncbi:leydig cell tumor 10 kDa protein homolog [Saccostrea echinata]|uniref:leydig cell tumor 10 kDa protein homolog n=1 Tax=Saccostrea echinata TaxID=191078 RepID=UPI002A80FBD8|nr:leydig cell tumor 10 kDa protein homolog [Saccostrea echinata]XP_061198106.1 leydig cell tumor 10 kDa protein homolog [Saccostrea echinata]